MWDYFIIHFSSFLRQFFDIVVRLRNYFIRTSEIVKKEQYSRLEETMIKNNEARFIYIFFL